MLAGQQPRRQHQEQRPQPDRADLSAMNLHRWLAAALVLFALAGCAQEATNQGRAPYAPYSPGDTGEYPRDRGGDGGGGGGGM